MAKYEATLMGDYYEIAEEFDKCIREASFTAELVDESEFIEGESRCLVKVYERYSAFSGNRVSLTLTLFKTGKALRMSAITAGGSNAVFWKVNTLSEESFLKTINKVIDKYSKHEGIYE